jgi:hypothetical protein
VLPPNQRLPKTLSALTALLLAAAVQVRPAAAQRTHPTVPVGEVATEAIGGTLLAMGGAVGFGVVGALTISPLTGGTGDCAGYLGIVIGAAVGTTLGAASGVTLGSWAARGDPRFGSAFLGSLAGMGFFFLVRPSLDPDYESFWIAWFGLPVIGAILGTHAFRSRGAGGSTGRLGALLTPQIDPCDRSIGFRGGVRVEF